MEHRAEKRKQTLPWITFYTQSLTGRADEFPGEERRNGCRWKVPRNFKCFTPSGQMNQQSAGRCSVHVRPPHWNQGGKANVRELQQFTESLACVFKSWSKVHVQLRRRVTVLKLRESPTSSIMWAGNSRAAHTEVLCVSYSSRPIWKTSQSHLVLLSKNIC